MFSLIKASGGNIELRVKSIYVFNFQGLLEKKPPPIFQVIFKRALLVCFVSFKRLLVCFSNDCKIEMMVNLLHVFQMMVSLFRLLCLSIGYQFVSCLSNDDY